MRCKRRKIQVFDIAGLHISPEYQREVIEGHVSKIESEFEEAALGLPCVGVREDGTKSVVDGMQRIAALKEMGYTHVECEWFDSNGPEHEALIFLLKNNYKKLKSHELFKARLTSGDDETVSIYRTINEAGLGVRGIESKHRQRLQAVSSAKAIFRLGGPELLVRALKVLKDAWGGQHDDAYNGGIMNGLAVFMHHVPEARDQTMTQAMRKIAPKSMYGFIDAAKAMRIASGGSRAEALAKAFHAMHDKTLRKKTKWVEDVDAAAVS